MELSDMIFFKTLTDRKMETLLKTEPVHFLLEACRCQDKSSTKWFDESTRNEILSRRALCWAGMHRSV